MRLEFCTLKVRRQPSLLTKYFVKRLFNTAFLTHTLTHTGKSPYRTSGTRSVKEDADSERKGLKIPIQRQLKGFGTFRNQQVARSSRVTSSRKKRLPDLGAFFLSGAPGFATRAKPAPVGGFPLRS